VRERSRPSSRSSVSPSAWQRCREPSRRDGPTSIDVIGHLGIESKRTAYRSPWQNGIAERWVGTVRRELLDHVIVLNERHLQRLLREYVDYYNSERIHISLRDSPNGRRTENRPSVNAKVVGMPRVGGLHHRYKWSEAA
jgi:putative transposase